MTNELKFTALPTPKTVADAIYQAAVAGGVVETTAVFLNGQWPNWFATEGKDLAVYRERIIDAALVRKDELRPAVWYRKEGDDNYIPLPTAPKGKDAENCLKLSCSFANSFSTQSLNGMRSRPNYKALVQEWRDDGRKYGSALFLKLKAECARQARGDAKRSKEAHAAPMAEKIPATLAALRKSNAFGRDNRGDTSAMSDKAFDAGIAAFWQAASKTDGRKYG